MLTLTLSESAKLRDEDFEKKEKVNRSFVIIEHKGEELVIELNQNRGGSSRITFHGSKEFKIFRGEKYSAKKGKQIPYRKEIVDAIIDRKTKADMKRVIKGVSRHNSKLGF